MPPFAFGALLERPPIVLEAQIIEIQAAKRQHPLAAGRIETPEGLIVIRVVVEHAGVRGTGTRGETIPAPIRQFEDDAGGVEGTPDVRPLAHVDEPPPAIPQPLPPGPEPQLPPTPRAQTAAH